MADQLNTKNVLIVAIAVAVSFIVAVVAILIGSNVATNRNADVAEACVSSGGTWISSDKNCLAGE
jgi:hypothetical protein